MFDSPVSPSNNNTAENGSDTMPPSPRNVRVPSATIAGGVIGGFAFVLLSFGVYLLLRRRRKRGQMELEQKYIDSALVIDTYLVHKLLE